MAGLIKSLGSLGCAKKMEKPHASQIRSLLQLRPNHGLMLDQVRQASDSVYLPMLLQAYHEPLGLWYDCGWSHEHFSLRLIAP